MKISIKEIVKNKLKGKAKYIPSPLIWLLARIVHEDDVNELLYNFGDKKDCDFITSTLDFLQIERVVEGRENLSDVKRYIIAANHPLGGLDGLVIAEAINTISGSAKVVVNDILMNLEPVQGVFTPINKHGRQKSEYAEALSAILASDTPILYFPAGLCSREIDGEITDLKWQKNFIRKAIEHGRDIIPLYVDDKNSNFFYKFARIREALKIRFNIEMLLLPGELFKKRGGGTTIRLVIGKKISHSELVASDLSAWQWCQRVRESCYDLANKK